jgi:hypothetical protein
MLSLTVTLPCHLQRHYAVSANDMPEGDLGLRLVLPFRPQGRRGHLPCGDLFVSMQHQGRPQGGALAKHTLRQAPLRRERAND